MASGGDGDALHEALIDNFVTVTGCDKERATFFMQSAAWNLQVALGAFYDDAPEVRPVQETGTPEDVLPPMETPPDVFIPPTPPSKAGGGGIATFSDFRKAEPEKDDKDTEKFYAGGSEHSGQMIEGPPRKKTDPKEIAKDVFEAAKKRGAVSVEEAEVAEKKQKSEVFKGTGFKLGDTEGPSVSVPGRMVPREREKVQHTLKFWANGFSVDDGPLRDGNSDADREFIASVSKGDIPRELIQSARGGEVSIDIQDNRNDPYTKPKPSLKAFSGEGHKLGNLTPEVVSKSPTASPASAQGGGGGGGGGGGEVVQPASVPINPEEPTTSLQIRLADGTRLVSKFNLSHTINDVRNFINLSCPSMSSANYVLMTTFPRKELTDLSQTLADAGLLNAVIVQRLK